MRSNTARPLSAGKLNPSSPTFVEDLLGFHRNLFGGARMDDPPEGTGTGVGGTGTGGGDDGAGGAGSGGGTGTAGGASGSGTGTGSAAPASIEDVQADTGWAEFAAANGIPAVRWQELPAEQQATYWRFHSRKNEQRLGQLGNVDALREKAKNWDDFEEASRTEQERAVREAEARGRQAATVELGASVAEDLIRARIGDARTAEEVDALLAPLDLTKFIGDNGRVDAAKVSAYVQTVTGSSGGSGTRQQQRRVPGMGQGSRSSVSGTPSIADGRSRYEQRKGRSRNGAGQ